MTQNGSLPDYLVIYSDGRWHITDRHGKPAFESVSMSFDTKLSLLEEAGASYQIIDPRKHKTKGTS